MEMTRSEKTKFLKEISKTLKNEFVGLDGIVDQIIQSVTPWYVTPEIITRPVIVSLWGMTGTGKTSIVPQTFYSGSSEWVGQEQFC